MWKRIHPDGVKKGARPKGRGEPARSGPPVPGDRAVDLYRRWAVETGWRGFCRGIGLPPAGADDAANDVGAAPPEFDVLVIGRAPDLETLDKLRADSRYDIPALYGRPVPGAGTGRALSFTATVARKELASLDAIPGLRWEIALPHHPPQTTAAATSAGRYGPLRQLFAMPSEAVLEPAPHHFAEQDCTGGALAVIDFGCPFLRPNLGAPASSRVVALWDQGAASVEPVGSEPERRRYWSKPRGELYGRELRRASIASMVRQMIAAQGAITEDAIYRSIDYLRAYADPLQRTWGITHGSHVLDVAAGRDDPLQALASVPIAADGLPLPTARDAAAEADLIFIQLPALTAADSSGGSLGAHILDGVRYAMEVCPHGPLVVNISYGSFAGPHDGTSLIEQALDELLALRPTDFQIVLSAGNARNARCHVQRTVRPGKPALLNFAITPEDTTDTFLELWYPRPRTDHEHLAIRARTAGREWSDWTRCGEAQALYETGGHGIHALLQHELHVAQGHPVLALLALAPTARAINDHGPLNEPGLWEVEVTLARDVPPDGVDPVDIQRIVAADGDAYVTFDAWIERDDPADNSVGGQQPHFCGLDRNDERNTFSSLATGAHTLVVGGYRWSDGSPAVYGSLPGTGVDRFAVEAPHQLPWLVAPCELDDLQPAIRAAGVPTNLTCLLSGTSVAAPVVARRAYNLMTAQRGQARDVLAKALEGVIVRRVVG